MRHDTPVSANVASFPRNPELLPAERLTDVELADQYGESDRRYRGCKPRREDLMHELQRRCEKLPDDQGKTFEGTLWNVPVKARGWETVLPALASIHRMFRAAKRDFYAAATITQKAIEEYLGKPALDGIKTRTQTGYRGVDDPILKQQPKAS